MDLQAKSAEHDRLQEDVERFLHARGFVTSSTTAYHDDFAPDVVLNIQREFTYVAMCLRGMPDGLAIHYRYPMAFYYECKWVGDAPNHTGLCIEAAPAYLNMTRKIPVLYCASLPALPPTYPHRRNVGFHAQNPHSQEMIRREVVWYPRDSYWSDNVIRQFIGPDAKMITPKEPEDAPRRESSKDPHLTIPYAVCNRMANWQDIIESWVHVMRRRSDVELASATARGTT